MTPGDYSNQPRAGDTVETGRYGFVTVVSVHDRGVRLVVDSPGHGRQTVVRAERGCWWRTAKALTIPADRAMISP